MASPGFIAPISVALSLFVVFHQPHTVSSDFLSPLLSPIFENVCKQVPCGKGSCRPTTENSMIPFECVCDPGWKQPSSSDGFSFLPCVIPNCTINFSCSPAASPTPAPAPAPKNATKGSAFDVCSLNFCGSGTCNKSSSSNSSYSCSCSEGYYNLMNSTSLPCFRDCQLGGDCHKLGLTLFNQTAHDSTSKAAPLQHDILSQVILVLVMFLATFLSA